MSDDDIKSLWDAKADEWAAWTGTEGDANRRFLSDPVLHRMLGDVAGRDVLDAGCGAGYLAVRLARAGARVVAIDVSPRMVEITRERAARDEVAMTARVDSAATLATVDDASVDVIASNYVLMDLERYDDASRAMARVLRPGGIAAVVLTHPCFGPAGGGVLHDDGTTSFTWPRPYRDEQPIEERWGPFSTPFVRFHRPLSHYVRAFREAGFAIDAMEEPTLRDPVPAELDPVRAARARALPFSIAFRLVRSR